MSLSSAIDRKSFDLDQKAFEDGRSIYNNYYLPDLDDEETTRSFRAELQHAYFLLGSHAGNLGMDDVAVRSMVGGFMAEWAMDTHETFRRARLLY